MKNALDRRTIHFTVAIFLQYENENTFSNNSNETRRNWRILADTDFANSGKKSMCIFYVVVFAVSVVVVVAMDVVEDDAEDDDDDVDDATVDDAVDDDVDDDVDDVDDDADDVDEGRGGEGGVRI